MNDRRMNLLKEKKEELVSECKVSRLKSTHRKEDDSRKIQQFDDARKQAVFSKANEGGSVLLFNEETMTGLKKKHPDSQP